MLGITHRIWPAHPLWAVFLLTVTFTLLLMYVWPEPQKKSDSKSSR